MKKLSFSFKSITHRLIFSCVVAAIGIYGVSYWQARQLLHKSVVTWLIDIAQARIDTVANEIEGKLQTIEWRISLLVYTVQNTEQKSHSLDRNQLLPLIKTLLEEQLPIQAIALMNSPDISGYYDRQGKYTVFNQETNKIWLSRCQINRHKSMFWSQPYPSDHSSYITYCVPLSADSNSVTRPWLAIEVNLNWIAPTMTEKLAQSKELRDLPLVNSFVFSPSNRQWIVKPTNSQLVQSWLSQKNYVLNNQQKSRGVITRTNSQGILTTTTVDSTNWLVGIAVPSGKLEELEQPYLWLIIASMSKDMLSMCVVIAFISQLTIRPLRQLNSSTEEMAQGNLNTILPEVTSDDEVGRLTQSFRQMRDNLQLYISNLQKTTAAKQKLESELSIAAQIQRTMVPRSTVDSSCNLPYQISALLKPARIVGGDLYDFFLLGSDAEGGQSHRLCLIIGDVADKGFPAALLMARTITLIRTLTKPVSIPSEILYTVNQELCINNEECLFVTVFCGVIALDTGKFTYASAGHDPPLLIRNQQVEYLNLETGSPLGLYEESIFEQSECMLDSNDLILLYTDGITEAMNSQGELFSETRLMEIMTSYPPNNPARAVRTIMHFCQQFVGDSPQSDDITLLALQYLPLGAFSQVKNIMEWNLTINSELTKLEVVKQKLGEIFQTAELNVELIEDAQLIVEEILVNIIQHGYENSSEGCIDLRIEMNKQQLMMTFQDSGKPFNPLAEITPPDFNMDDEERSLGGFGFYLVQQLAQEVDYVYLNGKNILTVRQAIPQTI